MTTLRLDYSSEDELNRKLRIIMRKRGFVVTDAAPQRLSVGELAKLVQRPVSTVSMALKRPSCPEYDCKRGKRRILWIELNDRLLSFLSEWRMGQH